MSPTPPTWFALAAAATLAGCQEVVDLGADEPSQLAIESRLHAGAPLRVDLRVTNSFGQVAQTEILAEATGYIEGSDGRLAPLQLIWRNADKAVLGQDTLIIAEGVTYTLHLRAPGFAPVTSLTTVPRGVRLDESPPGALPSEAPRDSTSFTTRLYFQDDPDEANYYHVFVRVIDAAGDSLGTDDAPALRAVPVSLLTTVDLLPASRSAWLFDDRHFSDGAFDARVVVPADAVAELAAPTAILEVRSVSRAYYRALRTDLGRRGNPVPSATAGADNVLNGGGLFASYATTVVQQPLR